MLLYFVKICFYQYAPTTYLVRNETLSKLDSCQVYCIIVGMYWRIHNLTKPKSTILKGPKNFFTEIPAQINLFSGANELTALQQSVQQNCYFAHSENLLLAMLGDEDKTVRAKALHNNQKIINAEEGNQEGERDPVQKFYLPS